MLVGNAAASPPHLAVFPFASPDARLGMAVADRLAHGLEASLVPPEVALALVPPYIVQEGRFLSPLTLLGEAGTNSRHAARVLQGALGVAVVVTGGVQLTEAGLELTVHVAREGSARSFRFAASEPSPGGLVRSAQAAVSTAAGIPRRASPASLDLSSAYGDFATGLTLLSQGLLEEAAAALVRAAEAEGAEPRWVARSAALEGALAGALRGSAPDRSETPTGEGIDDEGAETDAAGAPLLAAVVALNAQPFAPEAAARAFAALPELPLAQLWRALLELQTGQNEAAEARLSAFEGAWRSYPFGAVQAALYGVTRGAEAGDAAPPSFAALSGLGSTDAPAALLGGVLFAQALEDAALETTLAVRLSRTSPGLTYSYERLSQLAFNANDPRAAAQALRTATRLEPAGAQSDLYWTNLGWAYYLLGVLGESESASLRALELNANGTTAWYNLGLVQVVSGRLAAALESYAEGAARDLEANETIERAALDDLRDALERYPEVLGVHYALATLYSEAGQDEAAAAQFGRFVARVAEEGLPGTQGERGALVASARAQRRALLAPAPPLALSPVTVGLGRERVPLERFLPGDPLYLSFELSTPGDQLPNRVAFELTLLSPQGTRLVSETFDERLRLPPESVALSVGELSLGLPSGLPAGRYRLTVRASADVQSAEASAMLEVEAGRATLLRQLVGRTITLRTLDTGRPLYRAEEVADTGPTDAADARLLQQLVTELSSSALSAAETLPEVTQGRFAGQGGEALFASSTPEDVRDFLSFLLLTAEGTDAPFAELYARWAVAGAPTP